MPASICCFPILPRLEFHRYAADIVVFLSLLRELLNLIFFHPSPQPVHRARFFPLASVWKLGEATRNFLDSFQFSAFDLFWVIYLYFGFPRLLLFGIGLLSPRAVVPVLDLTLIFSPSCGPRFADPLYERTLPRSGYPFF